MRERGTEERSSSSLLSLTLWEEAEVEMFVGKSINMVSAVHADDGRHGRRTGGSGGGCVLLYIYKKARSTNCPSGFCSHHSSGLYFPSFELWGLVCLVVGGAHTDAAARNSHSSAPKGWRRLTKKFGLGSSRKKIITAQHFYVRVCVCALSLLLEWFFWRHDNYMNHHNHHQLSRAI